MNNLPAQVGKPEVEQRQGGNGRQELVLTFNRLFDERLPRKVADGSIDGAMSRYGACSQPVR